MVQKEFLKLCKKGEVQGGFLFYGPEEYTKLHCLKTLRKSLFGEEEDLFNHLKLSAQTPGWSEELCQQVCSLPMFAPKKLIELHGVDYRRLPPKELADLLDVLQLLPEHEECVLVLYTVGEEFDAGQPPRRASALYKKLEELITPLCFEYESESDLCSWVLRHLQASGISASPGDARKIVEFCSKDMFNLSNEVEKLICYTLQKGQKILNPSDIEQVCCGRSIDGAFDFTDALLHGQSERACRLLAGMKEKREKPENILGGVVDTLSGMYTVKLLTAQGLSKEEIASKTGMHSFRVKKFFDATVGKSAQRLAKALELCLSADLQIKSSSLDSYTVLDRLVLRLCRV